MQMIKSKFNHNFKKHLPSLQKVSDYGNSKQQSHKERYFLVAVGLDSLLFRDEIKFAKEEVFCNWILPNMKLVSLFSP